MFYHIVLLDDCSPYITSLFGYDEIMTSEKIVTTWLRHKKKFLTSLTNFFFLFYLNALFKIIT